MGVLRSHGRENRTVMFIYVSASARLGSLLPRNQARQKQKKRTLDAAWDGAFDNACDCAHQKEIGLDCFAVNAIR